MSTKKKTKQTNNNNNKEIQAISKLLLKCCKIFPSLGQLQIVQRAADIARRISLLTLVLRQSVFKPNTLFGSIIDVAYVSFKLLAIFYCGFNQKRKKYFNRERNTQITRGLERPSFDLEMWFSRLPLSVHYSLHGLLLEKIKTTPHSFSR